MKALGNILFLSAIVVLALILSIVTGPDINPPYHDSNDYR